MGLSPKAFARVMRLQCAARALAAAPSVEGTELALSHGYCDQAHLCRDFTALTGLPPTRCRTALDGTAFPLQGLLGA